jgi:hypothetical protein
MMPHKNPSSSDDDSCCFCYSTITGNITVEATLPWLPSNHRLTRNSGANLLSPSFLFVPQNGGVTLPSTVNPPPPETKQQHVCRRNISGGGIANRYAYKLTFKRERSIFWDTRISQYSPLNVNRRFGGTSAFTLVGCSHCSSL